jgi:hypothetical protein
MSSCQHQRTLKEIFCAVRAFGGDGRTQPVYHRRDWRSRRYCEATTVQATDGSKCDIGPAGRPGPAGTSRRAGPLTGCAVNSPAAVSAARTIQFVRDD